MAGIRRSFKCTQEGKKPLRIWQLRRMMELIPDDTLTGLRDRAILLLGFAKGARRSELASLTVESIELVDEGLVITMTQSKTNQTGEIERYGIAYGQNPRTCPVVATKRWLKASQITTGPLFRPIGRYGNIRNRPLTGHSIALIVKRYAAMIGLDATDFSGHSLRSGFVTEAASNGVSERAIMQMTNHKTVGMVRRYMREGQLFHDNASSRLGL